MFNAYTLFKVKRTSLWNKACEELRKHQEFIVKVQQNPEFLKEPFGDPFSGEDLKAQLGAGEDSEDSDSEDEPMNNQDDLDVTPCAIKGRNQQQNSLPFYSDGEEDDTDGEDMNDKTKSQKLDLKKHKSQKASSLNSSAYETPQQMATNGGSLQQNQPFATATKTAPPPLLSPGITPTQLVQSPPLISPTKSGTNKNKKEEKSAKDKKLSKTKQKEIHQQQQLLLAEATAKANASVGGTSPINEGVDGGKGDDLINGSSIKKKRGRPKKNKTEEPQEQGRNVSSMKTPNAASQQSLISSVAATSPQVNLWETIC